MNTQSIQLLPYAHEAFGELRTAHLDGQPWFVATDVCRSLGIANSRDAVTRLRQAEKVTVGLIDSGNRPYKITLVNEPGLYRLIFTSRKKEAEVFQDWVFTEVLPSIRKTGTYTMPETPSPAFDPLADCEAKIAAMSIRDQQDVAAYEALLALRQRLASCDPYVAESAVRIEGDPFVEFLGRASRRLGSRPFTIAELLLMGAPVDLDTASPCRALGRKLSHYVGRRFHTPATPGPVVLQRHRTAQARRYHFLIAH